jgi:hypothetical protein
MRYIEYIGVILAAVGFACLSLGFMVAGFSLGLLSCFFLIYLFVKTRQTGLFMLQCYFMVFNIIGLIK